MSKKSVFDEAIRSVDDIGSRAKIDEAIKSANVVGTHVKFDDAVKIADKAFDIKKTKKVKKW